MPDREPRSESEILNVVSEFAYTLARGDVADSISYLFNESTVRVLTGGKDFYFDASRHDFDKEDAIAERVLALLFEDNPKKLKAFVTQTSLVLMNPETHRSIVIDARERSNPPGFATPTIISVVCPLGAGNLQHVLNAAEAYMLQLKDKPDRVIEDYNTAMALIRMTTHLANRSPV